MYVAAHVLFQILSVHNVLLQFLKVKYMILTTPIQSSKFCNEELAIGTATRILLEEEADMLLFEGTRQETAFFAGMREFYSEAVCKILDKFPFREETIKELIILDPRNRLNITAVSVLRFMKRFMPTSTVDDLDQLQKELRDFKSMPESQFPEFDNTSPSGVDHFWANIGDMMQPGNSRRKTI